MVRPKADGVVRVGMVAACRWRKKQLDRLAIEAHTIAAPWDRRQFRIWPIQLARLQRHGCGKFPFHAHMVGRGQAGHVVADEQRGLVVLREPDVELFYPKFQRGSGLTRRIVDVQKQNPTRIDCVGPYHLAEDLSRDVEVAVDVIDHMEVAILPSLHVKLLRDFGVRQVGIRTHILKVSAAAPGVPSFERAVQRRLRETHKEVHALVLKKSAQTIALFKVCSAGHDGDRHITASR
mmetsp:Transcript_20196/g.45111  ORF Transcript_20196/g.45111 Transcript_20196/m.45111 type:complete len:235 (-) Transcript_20196:80-784(-)